MGHSDTFHWTVSWGLDLSTPTSSRCPHLRHGRLGPVRTTRATSASALVFLLLAAASAASVARRPPWDRLADLQVYLGAARTVRSGGDLYAYAAPNGDPFTYPPFAVLGFLPLTHLAWPALAIAWTVVTFAAYVALGWLVALRWDQPRPQLPVTSLTWLVAIAVLVSAPGQSNLRFGQISILVVLLTLADAGGVLPQRFRGVGIGIAAAVKLTPVLFVAHLLITGQRRAAARAFTTFGACAALAATLLPRASADFWLHQIVATDRIGDLAALGNQSVNGLLLRTGIDGRDRAYLWLILIALLGATALGRAAHLHRAGRPFAAACLTGCATLAASPVSWTHHQFWTVLAALVLVAAPRPAGRVAGWVLLVLMTVSLVDLAGRLAPYDHALFLAQNIRAVAVVGLSTGGLAWAFRHPLDARRPSLRRMAIPATAALACFVLTPLPPLGEGPATSPARATVVAQALASLCPDQSACTPIPVAPLNYGVSVDGAHSTAEGLASADVGRLTYAAAPGQRAASIPLYRLPDGTQAFAFSAGEPFYCRLIAYDHDGHAFGEYGAKFRAAA